MARLRYQLGRLEIKRDLIRNAQSGTTYGHRFVVESPGSNGVKIYVALYRRKETVEEIFGLELTELVGAGRVYVDSDGHLVLDGSSRSYGPIPHDAAEEFGRLLIPELTVLDIEVAGVEARTDESALNKFWEGFGFTRTGKRMSTGRRGHSGYFSAE